jgi:hypothetical protein
MPIDTSFEGVMVVGVMLVGQGDHGWTTATPGLLSLWSGSKGA